MPPAVGPVQFPDRAVPARFSKAYQGKLVADGGAPLASIEEYRRLAATLHHLQAEQGLKTLMVTSSVPQEGKTLTVVNLAMTLSESYRRRVLLIDADLRRPSIHDVFGISNRYGLCDALRPEHTELQLALVSSLLWVLPAGPPDANPMRALASERMERFLEEVGSSFDWILLDAPPVALMADAGLLARLTRAVILVIGAGSTPYAHVEKVVGELGREHIIGTVLNRVEGDATQWSGYYPSVDGSSGQVQKID
jgi:capsular exopolysaccharide synthesis family protein